MLAALVVMALSQATDVPLVEAPKAAALTAAEVSRVTRLTQELTNLREDYVDQEPGGAYAKLATGLVLIGVSLFWALTSHDFAEQPLGAVAYLNAGGFALGGVLALIGVIQVPYRLQERRRLETAITQHEVALIKLGVAAP